MFMKKRRTTMTEQINDVNICCKDTCCASGCCSDGCCSEVGNCCKEEKLFIF